MTFSTVSHLAQAKLGQTDFVVIKALELQRTTSPEWRAWREKLRDIIKSGSGPIPPEPERWADTPPSEVAVPVPAEPDPQQEIDALRDLVAEQAAEIERLRASDAHNFPENLTDKLSDWDTVQDEASLTTADLTEEVIQKLTKAKRKKFTELLNVELAELQQERGGPREDLKRENEIEALLGLFARVGEM